MIYFAYPNPYLTPPEGKYCTVDLAPNPGWRNLRIGPYYQDPQAVGKFLAHERPEPHIIVPLCEEAVLGCALGGAASPHPTAAAICSSKFKQRAKISNSSLRHLNPCLLYTSDAADEN